MERLRIYVDFAMPADALELLREGTHEHELVFPESLADSVLSEAEPDPQFATADIAFGQPDPSLIAETKRLKWMHASTSGITRYDTPEFRQLLTEKNIAMSNSASVYAEACAVHALSFMLAHARKLPLSLSTRTPGGSNLWNEIRASSGTLRGETVLIVGYGAIGKRLVELLQPFDVSIIAYRRTARGDEGIQVVTGDQLEDAIGDSDHVVNILPDSAQTYRYFDATLFSRMKPGSVLYNIGRGTTVDQTALLEALRSGHLASAWLDVTDPEPLPDDHPLWSEPNCFITPHVAGGYAHEKTALVQHFLENLDRFLGNQELKDRIV